MNFAKLEKSNKNEDDVFIDTLVKMLSEPHQDLEWNEKFKAVVRKHFDI